MLIRCCCCGCRCDSRLTIGVTLGRAGNYHTSGGTGGSTAIGTDVAKDTLEGIGSLGGDEGLDIALEDISLSAGRDVRPTKHGLHGVSSEEQERREGVHGRLQETETCAIES